MDAAWGGGRRIAGDVRRLLECAARFGLEHGLSLVLADAESVCGVPHLAEAIRRAQRAWDSGRRTARTLEAEVLVYLAARRQVREAIDTVGVRPTTEAVALGVIGPGAAARLAEAFSALELTPDDAVLQEGVPALRRLGIRCAPRTPPDRCRLLVFERMALLETEK